MTDDSTRLEESILSKTFLSLASGPFDFLISKHGFRATVVNFDRVRWENERVYVQVAFDSQRSYEVGGCIGRIGSNVRGKAIMYDIGEVARVIGSRWPIDKVLVATTESELMAALLALAGVLSDAGGKFFAGDRDAFEALQKQREVECTAYALERDLIRMRQDVDKAWHRKDYAEVVQLYKPFLEHLSRSEAKRNEIAINRSSSS